MSAAPATYRVERVTRASRIGAVVAVAGVVVLVSLPFWGESSTMRLIVEFICYLVLAQMWNLLAGYGGLISIGQQAFFGIGGYALFLFANKAGDEPLREHLPGRWRRRPACYSDLAHRVPPAGRLFCRRHLGGRGDLPPVGRSTRRRWAAARARA